MDRIASALLLGLIGTTGVAAVAGAACNEIPSASMLSLPAEPGSEFGFKGALGRIDRPYMLAAAPDQTECEKPPAFTVFADGICVGKDGRGVKVPSPRLESADELVALVYVRSDDGKRMEVCPYGPKDAVGALTEAAKARSQDAKGIAIDVLSTCARDVARSVRVAKSGAGLRIPVPDWGAVESQLHARGEVAAVRVVVAPRTAAESILAAAVDKRCSELCDHAVEGRMAVCIDEIFGTSVTADGRRYSRNSLVCDTQKPPLMKKNDFAKACENDANTTAPRCQTGGNAVSLLKVWQDGCGGVHAPFDWTGIRPPSNGMQDPPPRWVFGRTGVGGKKRDENPPVRIPGREFVGSTPFCDPEGEASDWRRPLIEVWDESENEPGLKGTVDQPDSIIHVYPRLATDYVCKGTGGENACMGIEQKKGAGQIDCACRDSQPEGCECEHRAEGERYFACGSGSYAGMPCTRDKHCKDGRCDGKPRCQKEGEVWTRPDLSGSDQCENDGKCNGAKPQCGYRLFNLENAIERVDPMGPPPKTGIIVLDAKLENGGPHKRRGVCRDDEKTPCGNGSGPGKCATGDCRGYQLKPGKVE